MGFRSLVSLLLVCFPIGATLGVLLGLDHYRAAKGFTPIFQDNSVGTTKYCQKSYGISPLSVGQRYTLNPNQWNWQPGQPGGLCMNVTTFANDTYPTRSSAPEFSATWQYPPGPTDFPVHAFPNIAMDATDVFPTLIKSLDTIDVKTKWTYGVGHKASKKLHTLALTNAELNANVAIDMFLDSDQTTAQKTQHAKFEIMIWLGRFGEATQPIGFDRKPNPVVNRRTVDGIEFELYHGENSLNQKVFTWIATDQATNFQGDIAQLITGLEQWHGPGPDHYLGYMGLGSETYNSAKTVTFWVPRLDMKVNKR